MDTWHWNFHFWRVCFFALSPFSRLRDDIERAACIRINRIILISAIHLELMQRISVGRLIGVTETRTTAMPVGSPTDWHELAKLSKMKMCVAHRLDNNKRKLKHVCFVSVDDWMHLHTFRMAKFHHIAIDVKHVWCREFCSKFNAIR